MKALLVASLLLVAASAEMSELKAAQSATRLFSEFRSKYNKKYATADEAAMRLRTYMANRRVAEEMAKKNPYATFGDNFYMDYTTEEMKRMHNLTMPKNYKERKLNLLQLPADAAPPPQSWNWQQFGAVSPVKNQGQCGSCWAFSVTGTIEGAWFVRGYGSSSLSEQALVSCDTWDYGCGGGFPDMAMTWLGAFNKGRLPSEDSYPYVSGWKGDVPPCNKTALTGEYSAIIENYMDIARDESVMTSALVQNGPLSVIVDATSFQTYTRGVLTNCQAKELDHAVLIIGYIDKPRSGPPYWIVKNSWGEGWGDDGLIYIQKGVNACLIREMPTVAVAPSVVPPGVKRNPNANINTYKKLNKRLH